MKIATKWKESAYYELCGSKKELGFGCMRLPMQGEEVDLAQFSQMVDEYLAAGFNCFDTARVYLGGKSEPACPQHLPIRQYLKDAAKEFEKK
ncbi:MAG: aldo/keto reductase [Angelakisella sp.]